MTVLIIVSYAKQWNLQANFFQWPLEIRITELLCEVVFDIFAIGYMVSIHHRNFKKRPKKRRRFVSTKEQSTDVNDEEYDSDDGTPSVEHVSIYDDSEPSIESGTVA